MQMMSTPSGGGGFGGEIDESAIAAMEERGMESAQTTDASVKSKATSAFFAVPGTWTILGDREQIKVTIAQFPVSAHFRYSTVPKLAPRAYLKAKVKNTSPYILLAGEGSVFLDSDFVAVTSLELTPVDFEFWLFLGVDEEIAVTHKLVKQVKSKAGSLLTTTTKETYEYLITLTNNKKAPAEVVVWDQLPISSDKRIGVQLIEPEVSTSVEGSAPVKKNDLEYIEWYFVLKPGQLRNVPFKFSVETPKDSAVFGL